LRRKFDFILNRWETIDERRLNWLGNVTWQPDSKLCKKILTAWIQHKRTNGGQKHTLWEYNATAINCLLTYNEIKESPSKECPSMSWIPLA
jgi:hypothetical protein